MLRTQPHDRRADPPHRRPRLGGAQVSALALLLVAGVTADVIPKTSAETASGKKLTLPDAVLGHPSILVVGFSKSAGPVTAWWQERLLHDFPTLTVFTVAH